METGGGPAGGRGVPDGEKETVEKSMKMKKRALFGFMIMAALAQAAHLSINAASSNASVQVQWYGEGGVHYALEHSTNLPFPSKPASTYHLGGQGLISVGEPQAAERGFYRVETLGSVAGVGVAQSGPHAGKLVYHDTSGSQALLRVFGVNYYDAFTRYLADSNDTSFVEGFAYLQQHNIPLARVLGGSFWPKNWGLYFTNRDEYFRRLDYFVEQAEVHEIGLILSCFWLRHTVGEVVEDAVRAGVLVPGRDFTPSDPLNTDVFGNATYAEYTTALGRPDSGSNAFIRHYTRELVSRYAASPAIWGWEFGNEYNLGVDHPNITSMRDRPGGPTVQGMLLSETTNDLTVLPSWTGPDDLTRADVRVAKRIYAETVRSIDTWRFIMSGDSNPRRSAYHNWTEHVWTADTRTQNGLVMPVDNPDPMDTVTVHVYPGKAGDAPVILFPNDGPITNQWLTGQYLEMLEYYNEQARLIGRPLIVGEWGAAGVGTSEDEKQTFHRFIQALIDAEIQISLLWTFDTRNSGQVSDWFIHTGQIDGWPATEKIYQIWNDDPGLLDLKQANLEYGKW